MAVVSCALKPGGRRAGADSKFQRVYTRQYTVETDAATTSEDQVLDAPGIAIGSAHPDNAGAFARSITADEDEADGCQWTVTIEWGPWDDTATENPLDEPPSVDWSFTPYEEICDKDRDGDAIVNSAGDYFDPPVTRDRNRPVLSVTRNESSYDPSLALALADVVNDSTFFGAAAGKVKAMPPVGRRAYHPACGLYYQVSYQFHFNADGWSKSLLDQGMRILISGVRSETLTTGVPITTPVPLNGSGALATAGSEHFLSFDVYPEADFSLYNLE